jgi:hypothetical protein
VTKIGLPQKRIAAKRIAQKRIAAVSIRYSLAAIHVAPGQWNGFVKYQLVRKVLMGNPNRCPKPKISLVILE